MKRLGIVVVVLCTTLCACSDRASEITQNVAGGDAIRGKIALEQYECGVCHVIPDIRGARGAVGPPLAGYARNVYIAGKYPNQPERLVHWIIDPPSLAPKTAMPAIGVTEPEARDMAAYLYSLE